MNEPNRFRFRAWDKEHKLMIEIHTDTSRYSLITMCSFGNQVGFIYADGSSFWNPHCVLMQSIGLLDKNGNEIFEGDICRFKYASSTNPVGIIKWDADYLKFFMYPFSMLTLHLFDDVEVIGNIYENQELYEPTLVHSA